MSRGQRERRPIWRLRPGLLFALVVLLLGVLVAAPELAPVPEASPTVSRVGADRAVSLARAAGACPAPVAGETTATSVTLAAPGPPATGGSSQRTGSFTLAELGEEGTPLLRGQAPGSARHDAVGSDPALVARATGGSAPGLAASQLTRSTDATMRGLAGTVCEPAATDSWFVGSGAVVGQRGRVYLTNLEATPAIVDLTLYGPDGVLDAPDGRGISIAPGNQEVRLLDALAPGVERFAIHVHARLGRVSAAVRDFQVSGLTPLGADWVPMAATPRRRLTVAGVPGGTGERLLQIVTPGSTDAIVRLRLLSPSGASTPSDDDVIEVRAGTVAEVDLAPYTAGQPVSVVLESDTPVTAGVLARVTGAEGQLGEIAYVSAGPPIVPDRPAVLPDLGVGTASARSLTFTAGPEPAEVRLDPLPPAIGSGQVVRISADTVITLDLATVTETPASLVLTPVSGEVYATYEVREAEERGPFLTSLPLRPGRYVVEVPTVVRDLRAGVPPITARGR
jgi:hypothetical protein